MHPARISPTIFTPLQFHPSFRPVSWFPGFPVYRPCCKCIGYGNANTKCRTNGILRDVATGLPGYRATGLPGYRATGCLQPGYRATGCLQPGYRATGLPGYRATGLPAAYSRATGLPGYRLPTAGLPGYRATGYTIVKPHIINIIGRSLDHRQGSPVTGQPPKGGGSY